MAKKNVRAGVFGKMVFSRHRKALPQRSQHRDQSSFPWVPLALWAAFSLVGGYVLFFSPSLSVVRIEVRGESIIPSTEYQTLIEEELEGSYFRLIQKRNYFLLPLEHIAAILLERYPKLSQVALERSFPDGLQVNLSESPAILLWCSGGPCYGLRGGVATTLAHAEDGRYDESRLTVIDESALPVKSGTPLPVERYLEAFQFLHSTLPKIISTRVSTVATTPSRHSNELAIMTEEGWRILVSVERPIELNVGMLQVFLGEYAQNHVDRSRLDSIDLRVEGKVFYADQKEESSALAPVSQDGELPKPAEEVRKKKKDSGR